MANYKEEQLTADKWVRSNRVTITNPYQGVPKITFGEEEITLLSDGRAVNLPLQGLVQGFTDPTTVFPVLNPVTGEDTGTTATYGDLYVMLHSLYISLAKIRDAEQAVVDTPTEPV